MTRRRSAAKAASGPASVPTRKAGLTIPLEARARAKHRPQAAKPTKIFGFPEFPPGVVPESAKLAMDSALSARAEWAQGWYASALLEGQGFLGYAYLSELAQRPEYRAAVETIATDATRNWIRLTSSSSDDVKSGKLAALMDELERLNVKGAFRRLAELDGFFGRAHLFLDMCEVDDRDELKKPAGTGWDRASKAKVRKGALKAVRCVEPIWVYPSFYDSNDPLREDWYNPQSWFAQGKEVHRSRLLTIVSRPVPDVLKPAYAFGGLALTQMMLPYVDNWLRTRQSVSDLIYNFSVSILKTDMQQLLQPTGPNEDLFARVDLFNNLRANRGLMVLNKGTEEFENVSTPLSSLDSLQAQAQEQMCSVSRIPVVKMLGIQPAGLNASSDGELQAYDQNIASYQEAVFREPLRAVLGFAMLSLWGEVDTDIGFEFLPLREMDAEQEANIGRINAERDSIYIESGAVGADEVRQRIATEDGSPYQGLDVEHIPDATEEEIDDLETAGDPQDDLPNPEGGEIDAGTP